MLHTEYLRSIHCNVLVHANVMFCHRPGGCIYVNIVNESLNIVKGLGQINSVVEDDVVVVNTAAVIVTFFFIAYLIE